MELLRRFNDYNKSNNLFSPKDKLLLAVSGGVDSVVLCELCKQSGFDFTILHCNFQLRGEESARDEKFVNALGKKYGAEILVKTFNTEEYATANKLSIQEAARVLRYEWFGELVWNSDSKLTTDDSRLTTHHSPPDCYRDTIHLLTAHHADDNAETVLMNFCRGTGLHGLTGIPVSYGHIKRPLLGFAKNELLQFAKEHNLDFVEDSSNLSSKYTRNLFRNEIIPAIAKVYPQVNDNLNDNISRFKEIEKLYQLAVGDIKKKLVKEKGSEWHIPVKQLMSYNNRALIYEMISGFGFSEKQIDEVIKLAESDSGKYIDSPAFNYRIIKHRHWFIISPVHSAASGNIIIEKKDETILFEEGLLKIEWVKQPTSGFKNETGILDANDIVFPLLLRKWKLGDYFYPLGMKKKKKLSRFFIDQKFSKTQKEKTWVIEMDKKIIWVVGHRIDERFKVTEQTKSVLKLSLKSA
jgi:tRNA(Ile)-lysidine synthase